MNNIRVRLPHKLAKSVNGGVLAEEGRLNPVGALGITLNMLPVHRVTMTLSEKDLALAMHDLVEVYNHKGSVGIYRVTKIPHTIGKNRKYELSHGLDVLSDATFDMIEEYKGTVDGMLAKIINAQTQMIGGVKYWRLGVCEDTNPWNKDIKYDNLMECLTEIAKKEEDYMFTFDQSTFPWTLNFVARDSTVLSEFRLNRNTENCVITEDDADLCTRLYLSVTSETNDDEGHGTYIDEGYFTYNDTTAQSDFGIICKTAGVNQEDFASQAALEAWVAAYFGRHNKPGVQITIDGVELNKITGESIDEVHLSRICRVALPEYSCTFNERIVSVNYPDALRKPTYVRNSLANKRQTAEDAFSEIRNTATSASKSAGGAGRAAHNDATYFRRTIGDTANGLYSRIEQTAEYIRAEVMDTANGLYSRIEQTASYIRSEVADTANGLYSKIEETASYIRSEIDNSASGLYSRIEQTANSIRSEVNNTAESIRSEISQTASTIRAEVSDATSAASIVLAINNGASEASIYASKINLSGYVTASQLETVDAKIGNLISGVTTATLLKASTLQASTFSFDGDNARWGTLSLGTLKSMTVMTHSIENQDLDHYHNISISESSGVITVEIGAASSSAGSDSFNMADTAFYQNAVSAATISGKNAVTITKGNWSGGQIQFNKSEGTTSTKGVRVGLSGSWVGNDYNYTINDYYDNPSGVSTGYTGTIDASGRYNAGVNEGGATAQIRWKSAGNTGSGSKLDINNTYEVYYTDASGNPHVTQTWYVKQPTLQEKTATSNGPVTADSGYHGLSKVNVDVSASHSPSATATLRWTGNVSGRTELASARGSSLANTYILIDVKCGGSTKGYYITINP